MLKRSLLSLSLLGILLVAPGAHADELPAGVFRMQDGRYFHPSSNTITANLEEIIQKTGSVAPAAVIPVPSSAAPDSASSIAASPLMAAIQNGRQRFSDELAAQRAADTFETMTAEDSDWRRVGLAIWDPKTNALRFINVMKNGVKLKMISDDITGLRVTFANGVNSTFRSDRGEVVVAVRYSISKSIGTKKQPKFKNWDVLYTPYSAGIHTPEMVRAGTVFVDASYAKAMEEIRASGAKSKAYPEKTLAEATDLELAKLIIMIEHVDNTSVQADALRQVERFLVTMAANKEDAYAYSRSPVGALGTVQFMPKSYEYVTKLYPSLKLDTQFERAMINPVNAFKAQMAYQDYLLAQFPKESRAKANLFPSFTQELVAAAYNGGAARVKKAMVVWEENLNMKERLHVLERSRLRLETAQYITKLRLVRPALMVHVRMALATP